MALVAGASLASGLAGQLHGTERCHELSATKDAFENHSGEDGTVSVLFHSMEPWPVATNGLLSRMTWARRLATLWPAAATLAPTTNGPSPVTINDLDCKVAPSEVAVVETCDA